MPGLRYPMLTGAAMLLFALAGCQGQVVQPSTETPVSPPQTTPTATASVVLPLQGRVRPPQVPSCKSFNETPYKVCDEFLTQWEWQGGLLRFGLPLSDWFYEVDDASGETNRVQYFERHVIKLVRAKDVSMAAGWGVAPRIPLGQIVYDRKYPKGAPGQVANKTGRVPILVNMRDDIWLGGRFGDFGSNLPDSKFLDLLEWIGTPFTNEFVEKNEVDGKEYKVQYFEQAALEYHPEKSPPNDVQFAPLGLYEFRYRYPNGVPSIATPTPRPYVTPEPGQGCWRREDLPPTNPTPAINLAQAEASARTHYMQTNNGRKLGPLTYSKHVSVDITGAQSDIEILRDAWQLSFLMDVPTPTPYPTREPISWADMPSVSSYMVYLDAETGQVLPSCEWDVIATP